MTEIPEHLLKRSKSARSRLEGGDAAEEDAPAAETAVAASPAEVAEATAVVVEEKAPEPLAPYVEAAHARKKIPYWVLPVLLALPLWAFTYVGTLESPPAEATGLAAEGDTLYEEKCASCHGATGGGGIGPQLSDGEVLITFPDVASQIQWVALGSDEFPGSTYGATNKPIEGGMPGFIADGFTVEELVAVVLYERAVHGDSEEAAQLALGYDELHDLEDFEFPEELPETVEGIDAMFDPIRAFLADSE